MNSMIGSSRLLAAALCGLALAGCNAIKDVRSEPFIAQPAQQVVLEGTVTGLGSARALVLQANVQGGNQQPVTANRNFFGTAGETVSPFSFGTYSEGRTYTVTVSKQPFGKQCTVSNGSGTLSAATSTAISVTCVPDPAIPRYKVTVNTSAVTGLPNLKVSLITEEGVREVNATGVASVQFDNALFNSQSSLPVFRYKVRATTDTTAGGVTTTNYCTFTPSGSFTIGGENLDATAQTVVPTADATVTVNACSFTLGAVVSYNTPAGGTAQTMPSGGVDLALRNHVTGVDEQTVTVNAYSNTAVTQFSTPVMGNANTIYELVVKRQPTGHYCTVSSGHTFYSPELFYANAKVEGGSLANVSYGSAYLLLDPSIAEWWSTENRQVRCRAIPVAAKRLTGTYQMNRPNPTASNANPARPRIFLTFFADGTFMNGINHTNSTIDAAGNLSTVTRTPDNKQAASGVIHGFYDYDNVAGTIAFTVLTASNLNPSSLGLDAMPGYTVAGATNIGSVTAVNVVKTPPPASTLSMSFIAASRPGANKGSPAITTGGPFTWVWSMTEPVSTPGQLSGTWVSADHLRVFIYNNDEVFGFHMGVNGLPNAQDTCYLVDDFSTQMGGVFTRHSGNSGNCSPGGDGFGLDTPFPQLGGSTQTAPHEPPIFNGRLPNSRAQFDGRPTSPDVFSVTAGTPDILSVQATLNTVLIDRPVLFQRERAN